MVMKTDTATVQDLAVQPGTDVLFASSHSKSVVSTLPTNHLVTIDKSTGAVTLVGDLPDTLFHSIGFDPNTGVLYDMGSDGWLYNINPADASNIPMVRTSETLFARGLGVDDSGRIWVSHLITNTSQPIWTVNPATGQATFIGDGPLDLLADLAFVRGSQDSDSDGVHDPDDLCANTVVPEGVPTTGKLNPNHWALTKYGNGFDFDTVIKGKGKGPNRSYTIEDTAGCSCEQITEMHGLGDGHMKHGCNISAMDDWVEAVNL